MHLPVCSPSSRDRMHSPCLLWGTLRLNSEWTTPGISSPSDLGAQRPSSALGPAAKTSNPGKPSCRPRLLQRLVRPAFLSLHLLQTAGAFTRPRARKKAPPVCGATGADKELALSAEVPDATLRAAAFRACLHLRPLLISYEIEYRNQAMPLAAPGAANRARLQCEVFSKTGDLANGTGPRRREGKNRTPK